MSVTAEGWALTACVLIRTHARPRQWLTVDDLAQHLLMAPQRLCDALQVMQAHGLVELRLAEDGAVSHVRAVLPPAAGGGACA